MTDKIIYIVTDGEGYHYYICGVFDDPALAKEFQEAGGYDGLDEYPVNPYGFQLREGWNVWEVDMLKNGATIKCEIDNVYLDRDLPQFVFHRTWQALEGFLSAKVLARSEAYAIKIVNEKRTQFIAENKWGEGLAKPPPFDRLRMVPR